MNERRFSVPEANLPSLPAGVIRPECLGFDFDGVIADIGEAFIRLACRDYGYCSIAIEDLCSFQVEQCLPIDPAVVESIFASILEDSIGSGLKPITGAIETLTYLSRQAPVTIITARHQLQPVYDWLDHHCPPATVNKLRLIATGDHDAKEEHLRACGLHHFIDDRAATCRQLAEAGFAPIVYSQPWNRNQHNLPSVANWSEIGALVDRSAADDNFRR